MSQSEIDDLHALFAVAVAHLDDVDTSAAGEPSGATAWDAILALQRMGSRTVLDFCVVRCASLDPRERRVAAAVLGQLGMTRQASAVFIAERFQALNALLLAESAGPSDARVLSAACIALGHLHDPRAIPAIATLRGNLDVEVRCAVVHGLLGHGSDEAVAALITLSNDAEARVRDWATFGLGQQIEIDTPAVRAALAARLTDPDADTRQEAFTGLAKRGEVMVAHRFDLPPDATAEAYFHRPSRIGDALWCCTYRLRWPDHEAPSRAYGLDGSRALLLAMMLAHRSLLVETAFRLDHAPSSTETIGPVRIDWPGADALRLGRIGADDLRARLLGRMDRDVPLNRIILTECGPRFLKVARVAGAALHAIGHRSRSARLLGEMGDDEPDALLETVLACVMSLVAIKILEVRGDPALPRYSEVRLPNDGLDRTGAAVP